MIDFVSKYISKHFQVDNLFPEDAAAEQPKAKSYKNNRLKYFLLFLKTIPWLCLAGFIYGFFWDFGPNDFFRLGGFEVSLNKFITMLSVSGLIGYGTNYLAIKMLFKPRQRRPIFGQGLLPANKDRLAVNIASLINNNILNEEHIKQRIQESGMITRLNDSIIRGATGLLNDKEFQEEVKMLLYNFLKDFFNNTDNKAKIITQLDKKIHEAVPKGLPGVALRSYMMFNRDNFQQNLNDVVERIPDTIKDILDDFGAYTARLNENLIQNSDKIEEAIANAITGVVDKIQIYGLLKSQLERMDESRLEQMVMKATSEQLDYIQYLGGLLGILGGIVIWEPRSTVVLGSILGLLIVLDNVLFAMREARLNAGPKPPPQPRKLGKVTKIADPADTDKPAETSTSETPVIEEIAVEKEENTPLAKAEQTLQKMQLPTQGIQRPAEIIKPKGREENEDAAGNKTAPENVEEQPDSPAAGKPQLV